MQVPIISIGGHLSKSAVWRTPVVVDIAERLHYGGKQALVDVSRGEARLPEIRLLVRVV